MQEPPTIVIVDDTPSIRVLIGFIVKKLEFATAEAGNGVEAMTLIQELRSRHVPIKLIVTDLHMPTMNGVELIREIRKTDKTTPILMLTTETLPELVQEGKVAGANAWVVKPIKSDAFAKVVQRLTRI